MFIQNFQITFLIFVKVTCIHTWGRLSLSSIALIADNAMVQMEWIEKFEKFQTAQAANVCARR